MSIRRAVRALPRGVLLAVLVAWGAAPCLGQVSLGEVTLGWEGQTHEGFLTMASVELVNSGDRDVRGTAYAEMPRARGAPLVYTHTVDMPAGGHKRVLLYPRVEGNTGSQECRIGFRPARGPKVERTVPLRPRSPEEILVLVCTESPPGGFNFIQMIDSTSWFPQTPAVPGGAPTGPPGRPRRSPFPGATTTPGPTRWGIGVAYTNTDGLPDDWRGYDGIELVVLDDFSPQAMSPSRQEALLKWMGGGGRVLVTGGEQFRRLSESFLAPYLPVAPEGTRTASAGLPALVQRFGGRMESAPTALTVGKPVSGTVWVAQDKTPIVASTRVGLGTLWYAAFSFTKRPVVQWDGSAQLLSWMLKVGRQRPPSIADLHTPNAVARELAGHSGSNPPSFRVITLFLLAYVLCLVPANYLILRKLDRRELAWVTTPAIVVLFSLLAYGLGFVLKGSSIVLTSVSVLELEAGTSAGVAQSYYSLFSPRRASYELNFREPRIDAGVPSTTDPRRSFGPDEEVRLDTPFEVASNEQDSVRNLVVQMWDQRTVGVRSPVAVEGDVSGSLTLSANGTLQGQVTNQFAKPITGASIVFRGGRATLGTLEPGQAVPVSFSGIRAPRGGEPTPLPPRPTEDRSSMRGMGMMGMPQAMIAPNRAPEAVMVGEALERGLESSDERFRTWVSSGFVSNTPYPFPDDEALLVGWMKDDALGVQLKGGRAPAHTARTVVIVHIPVP